MKKVLLALFAPALLLMSCATIVKPRGEVTIPMTSNVEGVEILINGISLGEDVEMITVHKGDIITAQKDGYSKSVTMIQGKFNGWVLGNLIFGGVIGIVVDGVCGNFNEVTTQGVNAVLKKKQ